MLSIPTPQAAGCDDLLPGTSVTAYAASTAIHRLDSGEVAA